MNINLDNDEQELLISLLTVFKRAQKKTMNLENAIVCNVYVEKLIQKIKGLK